jgi:hypothetical protein
LVIAWRWQRIAAHGCGYEYEATSAVFRAGSSRFLTALALDLPEHFFDSKVDKHISRLRIRTIPSNWFRRSRDSYAPARTPTTAA